MENKRIYITHCSAKKDNSLKDTGQKVFPDELYTATPAQRFMKKCKKVDVNWAIFSDLYGVWFPDIKHEWYEKNPGKVTEQEFSDLLHNFKSMLDCYDEIYFYHNPGRFHKLYKRLINNNNLADLNIIKFSHLIEIE